VPVAYRVGSWKRKNLMASVADQPRLRIVCQLGGLSGIKMMFTVLRVAAASSDTVRAWQVLVGLSKCRIACLCLDTSTSLMLSRLAPSKVDEANSGNL